MQHRTQHPGFGVLGNPNALEHYWPLALATRIHKGRANVIHVPFKKLALMDAISQFSHDSLPTGKGFGIYGDAAYKAFGITG